MEGAVPQGTIKEYDLEDHNGILLMDDRTEVYFDEHSMHGSGLRYLRIGQRVKFDVVEDYGRKVARHLRHITID
jgi:cold shock CspA family protein